MTSKRIDKLCIGQGKMKEDKVVDENTGVENIGNYSKTVAAEKFGKGQSFVLCKRCI